MSGRVVAVCLGGGGIPKAPVEGARVSKLGLVGDRHRFELHGGELRAVCLVSADDLAELEAEGVRGLQAGDFGENLLIGGLDFGQLRPGDHLGIGDEVVLELHDVRSPCHNLKPVDERLPDLMLGRSGFLARVIREGFVAADMIVRRVD